MNIFETMDSNVKNYSKTDLTIYEWVKKFPDIFANKSIQWLVQNHHVSQSALSRFAKRNGFDGFLQFQYQLKQDIHQKNMEDPAQKRSVYYAQFLEQVEDSIDSEQLKRIAQHIHAAEHVNLAGIHLSRLPARYLDITCKAGRYAYSTLYDPLEGGYPVESNDMYILYSAYDGRPQENTLKSMQSMEQPPYRVLIALTNKHPMRKYFDDVVVLPESKTTDLGHTVLTETLAFLMFDDLLTVELDKLKKSN